MNSSVKTSVNPQHITIVICSYNRAQPLRESLDSLIQLNTNNKFSFEILVVDNASTDNTAEVVKSLQESQSTCQIGYVLESEAGVSFARNRGVVESKTDWIAFFDDDQLADPDWLLELLGAAEEYNVKFAGGANHLMMEEGHSRTLKPFVRVQFGCTRDMTGPDFYGRARTPCAGNMLVHRDIFDEFGLFRTDLVEGGEDTELYHRLREAGYKAIFNPKAFVHHQIPENRLGPLYLRSRAMRMGEHVARREFTHYSRLAFPFVTVARLGQTVLMHGSKLLIARFSGCKEAYLERQCWWWLGLGYHTAAMRFLLKGDGAVSSLSFRGERTINSTKSS